MALRSCTHKGLRELFEIGKTTKIGKRHQKTAILILDLLDSISGLRDCVGVKGFHELKGNRAGTYSMHVSANYRITFKWDGKDVYDVNFEDYH
ncbi:type II toxin-antitoxin system RelE/ParE family toxin [Candidatus Acetothermia bacterium]|nr:type II toxin-antitoxin system RelE/ParE family toxin [Candidatus Acetothermia bacterium]MCI2431376.1 type II toxin-antitoxin system RelE/ParE family toxin [Candidatus Acetothermia bacterium]MCI2435824.1 type II toxin-antitoxin system RelE/ParE family toxin [Candidatus Acetothermia bacterium]